MSALPEAIPDRVGRYDVLLPIGTGGMATVYLAQAEIVSGLQRFFALKMMHPQLQAGGGEAAAQLIEEARLTASIRHPNVVAVHEAGEDPRGVYMVMDYVEGDTLSGLIRSARSRGERLPLPIVGRILADALAGLHAAHELTDAAGRPVNLVHRDYSPSNILVGTDGVTRLADFGVAKAESRAGATASGTIKGKIGYMAPEQVLAKKLDRRADVWAAGVVAWECLAGRRLHQDEDQVATLFRIVQEEPPLLATERPDLPEEIGAAIAGALTRDLEHRCPTAAELRRRLLVAWRAAGPLAEASEVGEHVTRVAGPQLAKRREKAAQVIAQRSRTEPAVRAAPAAPEIAQRARFEAPTRPAQAALEAGSAAQLDASRGSDATRPSAPALAAEGETTTLVAAPSGARGREVDREAETIEEVGLTGSTTVRVAAPVTPVASASLDARGPGAAIETAAGAAQLGGGARRSRAAIGLAAAIAIGVAGVFSWRSIPSQDGGDPAAQNGGSAGALRGANGPAASAGAATEKDGTSSPPTSAAGSEVAPSSASGAPAPSAAPAMLESATVRADAPIASLRVGDRVIALPRPARRIDVPLEDAERARSLRIDAVASDGRRASAELAPGSTVADLVFASAPRPAGPPPRRAAPSPESPPRLAPSPFEKH
jgi:serine/threonine-protein kinase